MVVFCWSGYLKLLFQCFSTIFYLHMFINKLAQSSSKNVSTGFFFKHFVFPNWSLFTYKWTNTKNGRREKHFWVPFTDWVLLLLLYHLIFKITSWIGIFSFIFLQMKKTRLKEVVLWEYNNTSLIKSPHFLLMSILMALGEMNW